MQSTIPPLTKTLLGSTIFCTQTNSQVKVLEHGEYWNGSEWIEGYFIQYPWEATHVIHVDRVGKDYLLFEPQAHESFVPDFVYDSDPSLAEGLPLFRMAA